MTFIYNLGVLSPVIYYIGGFVLIARWGFADASRDEAELMQEWFNIVHEKNVLVRYDSELMVQ